MEIAILVLHVLAAACVIGLVLIQHGKGADMGAAFGSGASGSLFGATGSANFLSRTTAWLAAVFFLTSMALTYFSGHKSATKEGVMSTYTEPAAPAKPVDVPAASTGPVQAGGGAKNNEIPK
jgi:preprotein translocase subunit SecG